MSDLVARARKLDEVALRLREVEIDLATLSNYEDAKTIQEARDIVTGHIRWLQRHAVIDRAPAPSPVKQTGQGADKEEL